MYYCDWRDPDGEARFTRCFGTAEERDKFIAPYMECHGIDFDCHTWEKNEAAQC